MELFLNVCLGSSFVLCSRDRVRADGPLPMPIFTVVLVFVGVVQVPMALYLYGVHSAWSWLYLLDPAKISGLGILGMILVQSGVLFGAWYLGARLITARRIRSVIAIAAVSGLLFIALCAALSGRLATYGSYKAFRDGTTAGLMDVKLGYVLIAMTLGLIAAASFVAVELVRDSRRVRAR